MLLFSLVSLTLILQSDLVNAKGKTYDDLDEIIKNDAHGKIASRENHRSYQEPVGDGIKIDPTVVVRRKKAVI